MKGSVLGDDKYQQQRHLAWKKSEVKTRGNDADDL